MPDIFFVKLNLEGLSNQMLAIETEGERSDWLLGFQIGASGAAPRDTWSAAKREGWAFGCTAREEALESVGKASRAGKASADARKQKYGSANPKTNAVQTPSEHRSEHRSEQGSEQTPERDTNQLSAISYQLSANNEQQQQHPPNPPRGERPARFVPPTEEEWVAYCTATWSDWHPACAAEAWAHYTKVGWKSGSTKIVDWKAAARTSHGKATQWGTLQPKGQQPRAPQQMPDWVYKKIQELKESIRRTEIEMRNYGPRQAYSIQECSKRIETMQAEIKRLEGGS